MKIGQNVEKDKKDNQCVDKTINRKQILLKWS